MMNARTKKIVLIVVACITVALTTNTAYQTVNERQMAVIAQYGALLEKWNPALNNPSNETLKVVIKKRCAVLKEQYESAGTEYDVKRFKALRDDLKSLPIQFMCKELDTDIETIFTLQQTARILNMEVALDPLPFQALRAAIDGLPCMIEEQESLKRIAPLYKYALALAGGALLANHLSLWPFNVPSN